EALGGLPAQKMHCSNLAAFAPPRVSILHSPERFKTRGGLSTPLKAHPVAKPPGTSPQVELTGYPLVENQSVALKEFLLESFPESPGPSPDLPEY
ncbi:hypothetical protein HKBW3S34_02312, partial [Candidatus Hakubella thermalkaliphila]